jgi:antitoxin CptB
MDPRLNRLRYRAWRRGFTEADLIFGSFADRQAPDLTSAQLDELEILLDQDDHDLYDWVLGRRPTPAAFDGEIMAMIRATLPTLAVRA